MKRRDFLLGGSALAGLTLPGIVLAQAKPCPPPSIAIGGGQSVASPCELPGATPDWFRSMAPGTWTSVAGQPGQRIIDVLPAILPAPAGYAAANPRGITDAWCGMAVDQRTSELLLVANGGHGDYYGNEAYGCVLRSENPAWKRLSEPTPNDKLTVNNVRQDAYPLHADGKPRSTHSSGVPVFARGRVWIPIQGAYSGGGDSSYACVSWDRDWATTLGADTTPIPANRSDIAPWRLHAPSRTMDPALAFMDMTQDGNGYSAFDPVTDTVWSVGTSGGLRYWGYNARDGEFLARYSQWDIDAGFAIPGGARTSAWLAIAPDLRLLFVGTTNPGYICIVSLDSGSAIGKPIGSKGCAIVRQTGPSELVTGWAGAQGFGGTGAVYHKESRSILWMEPAAAQGRIRRLQIPADPVGGNWATAWAEVNSPGGPMKSAASGIYTKFNIVEMGGRSALVCVTAIDAPVYVYKL